MRREDHGTAVNTAAYGGVCSAMIERRGDMLGAVLGNLHEAVEVWGGFRMVFEAVLSGNCTCRSRV